MLQQSVQFIERISTIPVLLVLSLVSIAFPAILFPAYGFGDLTLLDLYFSYSPDQVYQYLTVLGEAGRDTYIRMLLSSDLAFPVIYSLALSIALALILQKRLPPASKLRYLCLFPFLISIFDWCENLSLAFITITFPETSDWLIICASFFTSLKWSFVVLTVLALLTTPIILNCSGMRKK